MADSGDPDSNTGSMPEDTSAMRYATISEIRLLDNDDDFPPLRASFTKPFEGYCFDYAKILVANLGIGAKF